MPHPNIEFWRPMYGSHTRHGITVGGDVIAWKMALDRAGYFEHKYYLDYDHNYNKATVAGTKKFQQHHAIDPASGNAGQRTFEAMLSTRKKGSTTEWAFSPTAERLYNEAREQGQIPTEGDVAAFLVSVLWDMFQARDAILYTQERPTYPIVRQIQDPRKARKLDCSGECNYSQWLAMMHFRGMGVVVPALDPVYGYTGYGNTWSIVKGGMRVQEKNAQIGDCVWYHDYGHIARIVNLNPISVVSMGSNIGPLYLPLHYSTPDEIRTFPLIRS
jgi:hypothetical protein